MRLLAKKSLMLGLSLVCLPLFGQTPQAKTSEIPLENQGDAKMPDWASAETLAKNLIQLFNQSATIKPPGQSPGEKSRLRELTPESVALFFPREPFVQLKALPNPGAYHEQLLQEFAHHLQAQQTAVQGLLPLTYASLLKGSCKWKKPQSEYNHIPYWSCYRNRLQFKDAKGKSHELPIKTLINWGTIWYITHLGLPPKEP